MRRNPIADPCHLCALGDSHKGAPRNTIILSSSDAHDYRRMLANQAKDELAEISDATHVPACGDSFLTKPYFSPSFHGTP